MLNGFVIARRRVNAGGGPGPVSGVCVDWYVSVSGGAWITCNTEASVLTSSGSDIGSV